MKSIIDYQELHSYSHMNVKSCFIWLKYAWLLEKSMKCLVLSCGSHLYFLGILVVLRLIFCAISSVKSGCEPIKSSWQMILIIVFINSLYIDQSGVLLYIGMVRIECTCLWGLLYLCSYPCAMCRFCIRAIMYVDIMQNKPLSIYLYM